jgi:hypothetical protein
MSNKRTRLSLYLQKNRLVYCTVDDEGHPVNERKFWSILEITNLPRTVFFRTLGYVRRALLRLRKDNGDFHVTVAAILHALKRAAGEFGCDATEPNKRTDLAWKAEGKLLVGFQVHKDVVDEKRLKALLGSKTVFRFVILVRSNGYFRLVRQPTREDRRTQA